jgi:hypothetical protein
MNNTMFEIEYEFGEEDLIHFNEIQFMRNDEIQHNIKKNRWVVPGVMALIGSFYYFYYGTMVVSFHIGLSRYERTKVNGYQLQ